MSFISPAVSTPEKPPPITVKVRSSRFTSAIEVMSACSSLSMTWFLQRHRVAERLHRQRVVGEAREARQVDPLAERHHQVVERHLGVAPLQALEDHRDLPLEVDVPDQRLPHPHARQQPAQRRHRVADRNRPGRHLRQQRLVDEIVDRVDQLDVGERRQPGAAAPSPRTCRRTRRRAPGRASFPRHAPPPARACATLAQGGRNSSRRFEARIASRPTPGERQAAGPPAAAWSCREGPLVGARLGELRQRLVGRAPPPGASGRAASAASAMPRVSAQRCSVP